MVMDFIENGAGGENCDDQNDSERENGNSQQDSSEDDAESDFEQVSYVRSNILNHLTQLR